VWLAYDEHLDCPVAIKVLADNWTEDLHVRQRFLEEGRFLRKVESPYVVPVYDAGELADGRPYLVMAYADQGTLADRLELSALTPAQTVHVVTQVGRGLTALHDRGVLHRDVKPANVLFRTVDAGRSTTVTAMLGDLGLGKAMDMSSRLTMIGGTPTYVAPEQARGEGLDARADQYSLAALTYYLLAGRPPYDHQSLTAASQPGPPPMAGKVSPEVEAVVLRGLAVDREERYDDVQGFVSALAAAAGEAGSSEAPQAWIPVDPELTQAAPRPEGTEPVGDVPPVPVLGSRRRLPWVAAGVAALAVGLLGGWTVERAVTSERTLQDATGTISVTVPDAWARHVDPDQWTPPDSEVDFPSVAAGQSPGWNGEADPAPGVFVGILASDELPSQVPQHPECEVTRPAVRDEQDGDASLTVLFSGCTGAEVTVERVIQATADQLVWVQVRSKDRATANQVLDSVELHGM
jgi:hypothetical protein